MGEAEISYGQELIEVLNKLHCMKKKNKGFKEFTHMECMILFYLEQNLNESNPLGVRIASITSDLDIPKPATSKVLNSLEEKGCILRNYDCSDRRATFIRLTEQGIESIQKIVKRRDQLVDELMKKLGEDDARELIRIIDKLYHIVTGE
ncbi:MarR family winged helix-turn-helix transcriptional regulator [Anaerosporobacter faecicola]|uniref:MarR family winged helix-turn-helix transcriptional regulator n=1 Tax=Anaerosporobacter faecicola TaxID=2718714 RepID=UPI00143A1852|nr:winged helix DNA-binding protein [Anaerosporobacter faecicola]